MSKSPNINIDIGNDRKHALKIACAKRNVSMRDAIIQLIDKHLQNEPKPIKNHKHNGTIPTTSAPVA